MGFREGRAVKTILVVDDEADIAETLRLFLERKGYRVLVAYDGREAMEKALAHRPDLVVTDLMMPRMDGVELIHRLRESSVAEELPVIAMSANERSGHRPFLRKPFTTDELLAAVRRALGEAEA